MLFSLFFFTSMGRRMQSELRTIPISGVTSLKYQNKLSFEKANLLKKSGAFVFLPFFSAGQSEIQYGRGRKFGWAESIMHFEKANFSSVRFISRAIKL